MTDVKLSVVVPVYNAIAHIKGCIDNLREQNVGKEVEFILIDDGSTDGSSTLCEEFAKTDARVHFIKFSKNRGTLIARKEGILASKGDYITFLDPDDRYCSKDSLNTICISAVDKQVDIFHFPIDCVGDNEERIRGMSDWLSPVDNISLKRINKLLPLFFSAQSTAWVLWNKVLKTKILKEVARAIPDIYLVTAEDALLLFGYCLFAKTYAFSQIGYQIHYSVSSGVTGNFSLKSFQHNLNEFSILPIISNLIKISKDLEAYKYLTWLEEHFAWLIIHQIINAPEKYKNVCRDRLFESSFAETVLVYAAQFFENKEEELAPLFFSNVKKLEIKDLKTPIERTIVVFDRSAWLDDDLRTFFQNQNIFKSDLAFLPNESFDFRGQKLPNFYSHGRWKVLKQICQRNSVDSVFYISRNGSTSLLDILLISRFICPVFVWDQGESLNEKPTLSKLKNKFQKILAFSNAHTVFVDANTKNLYSEFLINLKSKNKNFEHSCLSKITPHVTFSCDSTSSSSINEKEVLLNGLLHYVVNCRSETDQSINAKKISRYDKLSRLVNFYAPVGTLRRKVIVFLVGKVLKC